MASIHQRKSGSRFIEFILKGDRRSLSIGNASKRSAESIKSYVERLVEAATVGVSPDSETAAWLAKIDDKLAERLAKVGLCEPRQPQAQKSAVQLGTFLDAYIVGRGDVKHWTKTNCGQARRNLVEYFGETRDITTITPGDTDEWRRWLLRPEKQGGRGLGVNTVRRHCGRAKQFFRAAKRKNLIAANPFDDMKDCGVKANRERDYFVTREQADKVLAACPDTQWKLVFALSRYGGLRCPSEHSALKWSDVDFKAGRMTVHSPKTEHHDGKASRVVPIFPELRPYLEGAYAERGDSHYVVTLPGVVRCRGCDRASNLGTQMTRIVKAAGLKPWPKLFHNLRASRQTELAGNFPEHVACEWIGNSKAVAREHYLRVTEADYAKAGAGQGAGKFAQDGAQGQASAHSGTLRNTIQKVLSDNGLEAKNQVISQLVSIALNAPRWTRTNNLLIKSQLLCQLS